MKIKSLVIILLSLILLISSYFIVAFFLNKKKDLNFETYITNIDLLIKSESFSEIDSLLISGESLLSDSLSYKRFLKRLYLLKKWDNLIFLAEKAYKKYPSDVQILSIYLYSAIRLNRYDEANKIIDNEQKNIVPESLKLETNIILGKAHNNDSIFYQILGNDSTFLYKKLFKITGDNNFLINKALLELKSGKYDGAEKTLSSLKDSNIYLNKLFLYTKYSNKKYEEVQNLLLTYDYNLSKEDLALLNIDISLKQKSFSKAFNLIEKFIHFFPDYSSDPYINLIMLKSFIDIQNLDTYINYSLKTFPTNIKLLYTAVDYYKNNKKENIALDLINNYLKNTTSNNEIDIISKQLKGMDNPDKFINNLFDLLNTDPYNPIFSKYLAWNLYANNKISQLKIFLSKYDNDNAWSLFFKALISSYEGDTVIAVDQFQNSFEIEKNWEAIFNQGVIYEHINKYQDAIEHYQHAENIITNIPANYKIKSNIRTSLAYLYYNIKDYNNAYREVENAIDQDKNNLGAYLLLKKLESSTF